MIAIIVSGITCAIFVGTFLFAFLKSKGVYDVYLEGVDKKEHAKRGAGRHPQAGYGFPING